MNTNINCGLCHKGDKVHVELVNGSTYNFLVNKTEVITVPLDTRLCTVNGEVRVDLPNGWIEPDDYSIMREYYGERD